MNLDQIETKCFILALFIRDDDERFLLGSRAYEFVDSQLHFAANTYQNDVVEVQGNDGLMLAGQVRRATSQAFDGYIGDSSVNRSTIEQYRRDFMKFFRKNHYYKVVYVFPDGTAIQRRNGFIVEAPEVKELYQLFPKYHISMNFEDINYYNYEEDSEGEEIYGESATLKISMEATGGLIWVDDSPEVLDGEGSTFTLDGTVGGNAISNVQLKGDTTQQTYSGKNLTPYPYNGSGNGHGVTFTPNSDGTIIMNGQNDNVGQTTYGLFVNSQSPITLPAGTYYFIPTSDSAIRYMMYDGTSYYGFNSGNSFTRTFSTNVSIRQIYVIVNQGETVTFNNTKIYPMLTTTANPTVGSYEPYVGGIPAPNPSYPQAVNTVTGIQVVNITDGDSQSQSYELDLRGKNLWNSSAFEPDWISNTGELNEDSNNALFDYIQVSANTDYTASFSGAETLQISYAFYNSSKTFLSRVVNHTFTSSDTITMPSNCAYVRIWVHRGSAWTQALIDSYDFQFELGSTATTYEAYNPIELCKIGTYQDYIYKSGSDWYIHGAVGKIVFDGSADEGWEIENSGTVNWFYRTPDYSITGSLTNNSQYLKSNYGSGAIVSVSNTVQGIFITGGCSFRLRYGSQDSLQNWKTQLSNTNLSLYYALVSSTDTQITNADLITQLNALAGATSYNGKTVFTVTSENQLAILSLSTIGAGGGGVVWDQYGAEWEEGTGGGPTTITVDSIDNVYPVWELTGPAINPQLSVLTTNTTLSYSGNITASQTLKVDMFNKTATLNGASVIGNVSGDWVYLKPGLNRVTYTTNNADASDSTIWWQEIVG